MGKIIYFLSYLRGTDLYLEGSFSIVSCCTGFGMVRLGRALRLVKRPVEGHALPVRIPSGTI